VLHCQLATAVRDLTDSGTAPETISLDDKMTWVADAGVDVSISPKASITLTAKYSPYKTSVGADPVDPVQKLKLDPLTFAAGLRWRF
jgi:outer membrane protein W